jgi:hypothetical protein
MNHSISEITDEDRTNEVGLFNTAESYWKSAAALYEAKVKASHPLSPVLFLYYHAIELYLKAFLRGNGHSAKELRSKKFGHRICYLTDRASVLGLSFMDEDKEVFSKMGTTDSLPTRLTQCMVRPRVARGFRRSGRKRSCINVSGL